MVAPLEVKGCPLTAPNRGPWYLLTTKTFATSRLFARILAAGAVSAVPSVNCSQVIILDGLTKCWRMPGLRICWIVAPNTVP